MIKICLAWKGRDKSRNCVLSRSSSVKLMRQNLKVWPQNTTPDGYSSVQGGERGAPDNGVNKGKGVLRTQEKHHKNSLSDIIQMVDTGKQRVCTSVCGLKGTKQF